MKLLLAEDTRDVNRAITFLLKHEKYEIDAAYDGEEVLEYLKTNGYDRITWRSG